MVQLDQDDDNKSISDENNLSSCSYVTIEVLQAIKNADQRKRKAKITKPSSSLMRISKHINKSKNNSMLSSEQLQLNALELEKKEIAIKMEKNRKRYQTLLRTKFTRKSSSDVPCTVRSTKKLTIPTTPISHLRNRLGEVKKSVPIHSSLTKLTNNSQDKMYPRQPTQVEPFNFATDKRLRSTNTVRTNSNIPTAELIQKFFQDSRSHYVPANAAKSVTLPTSPNLKTKSRCGGANKSRPMSYEEIVEEQMKGFEKNTFKARPINKRIFESMGEAGVPKVEARPPTEPVEFHLNIDRRASQARIRDSIVCEEEFEFKARPMPNFSSSSSDHQNTSTSSPRSTSAVAAAVTVLTVPVSPKLSGGRRASSAPARRQRQSHREVAKQKEDEERKLHKFLNQPPPANPTAPKEFSLATNSRGHHRNMMLQSRLKEELRAQKKARKIRAHPVPAAILERPTPLPVVPIKEATAPQPFQLRSEALHEEAQRTLRQVQLMQEEQKRKEVAFKAKPLPRTTFEEPDISINMGKENEREHFREPIKPLQVVLESDVRAQRRKEFDQSISQKMQELQLMQIELTKQKERRQNDAVRDLRRRSVAEGGLCFKAAPMPTHDPYPLKMVRPASSTAPQSPRLSSSRDKDRSPRREDVVVPDAVKESKVSSALSSTKKKPAQKGLRVLQQQNVKADVLSSSSCELFKTSGGSPRPTAKKAPVSSASASPRAFGGSRTTRSVEFAQAISNF